MESFSISDIYLDKDKNKVVDINPLPENCCNFDCVFCPFGKTEIKTKKRHYFSKTQNFIENLDQFLTKKNIDKIFINPEGEALYNTELARIVEIIKKYEINIKLLSNGYIFNQPEYYNIIKEFEEVVGELAVVTEKNFQKLQRPINKYTLQKYINNLVEFSKKYNGKFILMVNILKGYNDSKEKIKILKRIIKKINTDKILLETPSQDDSMSTLAVSNKRLEMIKDELDFIDCTII